jgi:DNA repair protein RecO
MPQIKTQAILLKGNNYRDRSKIVTLYTRSHGKMSMVAKGVRDVKSRWGGVLQSMAFLNIIFYYNENRTLHLISGADYARPFQGIYDDFEKMQTGFRIIELINKTSEEQQENEILFNLLLNSLDNLNSATKNYVNLLFNFEFELAKNLGFAINLNEYSGVLNMHGSSPNGAYFRNMELTAGDVKTINTIAEGNFNSLMELNISKASEKNIDSFFDSYFKNHIGNFSISKTQKVINSPYAGTMRKVSN